MEPTNLMTALTIKFAGNELAMLGAAITRTATVVDLQQQRGGTSYGSMTPMQSRDKSALPPAPTMLCYPLINRLDTGTSQMAL